MRDLWGTLFSSVKETKASSLFGWEQGVALHAMQGIGPCLSASGKSHGFSPVAVGTWDMFLSYGGGSHEKLLFVQRCQDCCLVMKDMSGI